MGPGSETKRPGSRALDPVGRKKLPEAPALILILIEPCCKQHMGAICFKLQQSSKRYYLNNNCYLKNISDWLVTILVTDCFQLNLSWLAASTASQEPYATTASCFTSLTHSRAGRPTRLTYRAVAGIHVPGIKHASRRGWPDGARKTFPNS